MIKVDVKQDCNCILEVSVKGHALYDDFGKDIICASASSIIITSINAILNINDSSIKYDIDDKGYVLINNIKKDKTTNVLLNNMIIMLEDLEEQYKKNIKVKRG